LRFFSNHNFFGREEPTAEEKAEEEKKREKREEQEPEQEQRMEKQTGSEGIFVAIRMRPLNEREVHSGQQSVYRCSTKVSSIVNSFTLSLC
jgi:hypothetical protein